MIMVDLSLSEAYKKGLLKFRKDKSQTSSDFSLELSSIYSNAKELSYLLDSTHVPNQIEKIIQKLKISLQGQGKSSIFVIDSNFGGGKTHSLVTICESVRKECKLPIIIIDGHKTNFNTIWGVFSEHINSVNLKVELLNYDTKKEVPPHKLIKQLAEDFSLLVIDEFPVYLKKCSAIKSGGTNLAEINLAFLHSLLVEVQQHGKKGVVLSLPGEELSYMQETKQILEKLKSIIYRQGEITESTRQIDVIPILQKRFFEQINIEDETSSYLSSFFNTFEFDSKHDIPVQMTQDVIKTSYPFHVGFQVVLWNNLSKYYNFQQIRGVLRVINIFFQSKPQMEAFIWIIGDLPIEKDLFDEVFSKLEFYELGKCFKEDIDQLPKNLHKIARTVVISTLNNSKGISRNLLIWLLINGIITKTGLIDLIDQFMTLSLYAHKEGDYYYYSTAPSLYRLIQIDSVKITQKEVINYTKTVLRNIIGGNLFQLHIFKLGTISKEKINLVIPSDSSEINLESNPLRNIVYELELDLNNFHLLLNEVRKLMSVMRYLERSDLQEIEKHEPERIKSFILEQIKYQFSLSYPHIKYYYKGRLEKANILYNIDNNSFENLFYRQLIDNHILIDSLSPEYILDTFNQEIMNIEELHNFFLRDTTLRPVSRKEVIIEMLKKGIENRQWVIIGNKTIIAEENFKENSYDIIITHNPGRDKNLGNITNMDEFTFEDFKTLYLIPEPIIKSFEENKPKLGEIDTIYIKGSEITKYLNRKLVDYSYSVKTSDFKILDNVYTSLSKLRLNYSTALAEFKIQCKNGNEMIFSLVRNQSTIEELHGLIKNIHSIFPQLHQCSEYFMSLVISDFREDGLLSLKFGNALQAIHKYDGELFLTFQ
jgi:hypothetical protein